MFLAHLHVFAATTLACLAMVLPATATASATASAAAAAAEPVYRHLSNTFALLLLLLVGERLARSYKLFAHHPDLLARQCTSISVPRTGGYRRHSRMVSIANMWVQMAAKSLHHSFANWRSGNYLIFLLYCCHFSKNEIHMYVDVLQQAGSSRGCAGVWHLPPRGSVHSRARKCAHILISLPHSSLSKYEN